MPRATSLMSAPTASQTAATALMKEILVARKALAAYLIVSADAGSVTITGAVMPRYSDATCTAAAWSSAPITMRSGLRKSWMAEPSRRNSGFDTTDTSLRPSARSTTRVEPDRHGRLVDDHGLARQHRADLAGGGLDVGEVGRAVVALGGGDAEVGELAVPRRRWRRRRRSVSRPPSTPSRTRLSSPASRIGISPRRSMATLSSSMSAQTTSWPTWAKQAPVVSPT